MRQSPEELDIEARQSAYYAQQRELNASQFDESHADTLGKAANGSSYIDPKIIASLGLANIGADFTPLKEAAKKNLRAQKSVVSNRSFVTKNVPAKADTEESDNRTWVDLVTMDSSDYNKMAANPPDWWERVDPNGHWRKLEVPDKVNYAYELLKLNEAELTKFYFKTGYDNWWNIPGIQGQKGLPAVVGIDENGKPIYSEEKTDFGFKEILHSKYGNFEKILDADVEARTGGKPSLWDQAMASIGETVGIAKDVVQAPFKIASLLTPDAVQDVPITPSFEVSDADVAGFTLEDVGALARGFTKGAGAVLQGGAQFVKNNLEQAITHPGPGGGLFLSGPSMTVDDYKKGVINSNILYQIGKQAFNPDENVDLGKGYFPEGSAAKRAIEAHDASLPKIDGRTWTLGRAVTQPLIQEGIIDKDGFAANLISGLTDGVFTVGTDLSMIVDPAQAVMKTFNLLPEAATAVVKGRIADKVREAWAAERSAAGLSTKYDNVIDLPWYSARGPGEEIPKFAGILPESTTLPDDVEKYADDVANELISGKNLAALDRPPLDIPEPSKNTPDYWRARFGVRTHADGSLSLADPTKIDAMPFTVDGRSALKKLASFDNAGELYDYFVGKIPIGAAQGIQDVVDAARAAGIETNLEDIHNVLKAAVTSGDPMYNMREVPGMLKRLIADTGKVAAYYTSAKSRQLATMPGSTFFSFDDPIASINDMNRLMVVMNVPQKERHLMLSQAIKAVTQEGSGKRFELANNWMKTVLGPALRKNGVPEEWIKQVTQWAGWSDDPSQWSMDAIGKGYPTPWIEDGAGEMMRSVDFLNQGFLMVSPDVLKDVVRQTSKAWKLISKARGNANVEKVIDWNSTMQEWMRSIQAGYLKPTAMGAPLPVRMIFKVVPDEMLRVAAEQRFTLDSLKALGATGHVNYTTFGEEIYTAKEMGEFVAHREHIDLLERKIEDAIKAKDGAAVAKYTERLSKYEAKNGTKLELEEKIAAHQRRIDTVLPGSNRKLGETVEGLMAQERKDPRVIRYERQRSMLHVYKTTDPKKWSIGTARDIVRMSESPEYQEVAKALLAGGFDEAEKLVDRFLTGDLRPIFDEYLKGLGRQNAAFPLDSPQGARLWVATIAQDIVTRTGEDALAMGAIATKKLGGTVKIISPKSFAPLDPTNEFIAWVENNLLPSTKTPDVAPFHATEASVEHNSPQNLLARGLSKNFAWYRDASIKYARSPYEQYTKWRRIMELMPAMDPTEAKKMVAAIDKTDAPKWLKEELAATAEEAAGTITRKEAEILGSMHAFQRVGDMLYDSSKKSYFGSAHAIFFGFFDAWREQWSVWTRQMLQTPSLIEKARLAKDALENTEIPDWAGGRPGRGIVYTDPDTGQQAVAIPFSRLLYSTYGLDAEEKISLKNLTLLGSAVPGVFGVGSIIMDSYLPNYGLFAKLRDLVYPYGDPQPKSKIADYVVPAWAQSIASGVVGMIDGKGPSKFDFVDNIAAMILTDTSEATAATTVSAVLTNIASNRNGVPVTAGERDSLGQEVQDKASWLQIIKGMGRIFLPGASTTEYYTTLGGKQYSTGQVYDDFRNTIDETEKAGGTFADGTLKFLNKWGPGAWIYLAGANTSVDGMQPTKEYAKWFDNNWNLLDKYPLIAGYLGPQEGEFDPTVFSSQRARGFRDTKTPEERIAKAQNSLAWTLYNNRKDELLKAGVKAGWTEEKAQNSKFFSQQMKIKSDELKKLYPSWNPSATSGENERTLDNQIQQIEKMVNDKKVLSQPAGAALKEYWDYRNKQIDIYVAAAPELANNTWRKSVKSTIMRQRLEKKGEQLVASTPEFSTLWERVLSREFDPSGLSE